MARIFTNNFITQAQRKNGAQPFQILEIDWSGVAGVKYYADRPRSGFTNNSTALPNLETPLVLQWPSVSLSLKEGQVGSTDQTQVVLDDTAGAITALLSTAEQQRRIVRIWRMFDAPSCRWGTDNGLILAGCLRPFDWSAKDNQITLNIGDLGPLLAKSISFPASVSIFTQVPSAYQDRQLPLAWGNAQRVEAVSVEKPWETHITQNTDGTDPVTVTIADDPSDLGVDGSGATTYHAYLGLDAVNVTFTQSSSPGTGSSTATITKFWDPVLFTAVLLGTVDGAGASRLIIQDEHITPVAIANLIGNYMSAGETIQIVSATLGLVTTTLSSFTVDSPWPGWYTLVINDPGGTIIPNLKIGDLFKFLKSGSPMRAWPTGTVLKQLGGQSIFVANALPSKNVAKVEGFGTITDQAGNTRKDFIVLGNYEETIVAGSATTKLVGGGLTVNLNDNTWNNPPGTGLGQNVTTITFPGGVPRDINANLDDDRIWVTLQGVEDVGDSTGNLITNPALVILQYLENSHLMNVAPASINLTSFRAATAFLAGQSCGFAQVEAADGLSLLQHIASLCHSVLFFDQGQANIVVLSDTPYQTTPLSAAFDTITYDNMLQGSLTHSESAVDDVINDLTVKARIAWDDKSGAKLIDSKNVKLTSIAAFGRIAKEINPCDIYNNRSSVAAERDWWLAHLSSIFRYVRFTAFLDALVVQPGDWIYVTWIDGGGRNLFGGSQTMQATKCADTGKDGLVEIEARYIEFSYS